MTLRERTEAARIAAIHAESEVVAQKSVCAEFEGKGMDPRHPDWTFERDLLQSMKAALDNARIKVIAADYAELVATRKVAEAAKDVQYVSAEDSDDAIAIRLLSNALKALEGER